MTTTLKAAPLQEPPLPSPDVKPVENKRPPGRPKGSRTENRATPPKASTNSRSLKTQIGGLLMTVNMGLMIVPSARVMALDTNEIDALATALEAQAKTSPRFKKYLDAALAATAGGQLMGVVAIIGARRAARLGLLGENGPMADQMLGGLLAKEVTSPTARNVNDASSDAEPTS